MTFGYFLDVEMILGSQFVDEFVAKAGLTAAGKPVKVSHRATNVFRREEGQWRLIHHHTDLSPQLNDTDDE